MHGKSESVSNDIWRKYFLLILIGLAMFSGVYAIEPSNFEPTVNSYNWDEDIEAACDAEVGSNWDVADWTQIEQLWSDQTKTVFKQEFMDQNGLGYKGADLLVKWNGDRYDCTDCVDSTDNRQYYVSRHNHDKPSNYLAHDDIDNYLLSLGSWNSNYRVLCYSSNPTFVRSQSNTAAPTGALWIEGNDLHWTDGSTEYWLDDVELVKSGSPGSPGALWIEGSYLHWIDAGDDERRYQGTLVTSSPGGEKGMLWIENGYIHYIDANGEERKMDK